MCYVVMYNKCHGYCAHWIYITDADYYYLFSSTGPLLGTHDASQFGGRTLKTETHKLQKLSAKKRQ